MKKRYSNLSLAVILLLGTGCTNIPQSAYKENLPLNISTVSSTQEIVLPTPKGLKQAPAIVLTKKVGWKTWEGFGFNVQYPKGWYTQVLKYGIDWPRGVEITNFNPREIGELSPGEQTAMQFDVQVRYTTTSSPDNELALLYADNEISRIEGTVVNGVDAYKITAPEGIRYVMSHGGYSFALFYGPSIKGQQLTDLQEEVLENILTSFKFTK
ncbi:MAG: hypothetical protein A3D53_01515 [Candidatus Magasanikbacteria bacterium RIFCSPHIGHO2_02_FULL_45_10]|uniref:Uncharacterized protein n=1 Tax=Candidatus Magasanikbacteria bacterium RIFCSPHIGHO2_02_FULL_45_10 TaxID=1798679 RepID=A0A1F6MC87_9BACT|nr:MAG: hypothetical protein A3D53_01515 [Candidatus Magasanikbacteria bacterium RIFCSPHIGHO2_02_FULL_45_10]